MNYEESLSAFYKIAAEDEKKKKKHFEDEKELALLNIGGTVPNAFYLHGHPSLFDKKISDYDLNSMVNEYKSNNNLKGLKFQKIEHEPKSFRESVRMKYNPNYDAGTHKAQAGGYEFQALHELGHAKQHLSKHRKPSKINKKHVAELAAYTGIGSLVASKKMRDKIRDSGNFGAKSMDVLEKHPWVPISMAKTPTILSECIADKNAIKEMSRLHGFKGGLKGVGLSAMQIGAGYIAPTVANAAVGGYVAKKIMKSQERKEHQKGV